MQELAPSDAYRSNTTFQEAEHLAQARQVYARKRAAEEARARCLVLGSVVKSEIIPRLVLLHRDLVRDQPTPLAKLDLTQIAEFTNLVLGPDVAPAVDAFSALVGKGYAVEHLFLDLLAPAAALLGRMWEEDLCDFLEVTTGVTRLQLLLSRFRVDGDGTSASWNRQLLLMSAPGEEHTFGVRIIEQFMRRAGWAVSNALASKPENIAQLVASEWFAVVGLTLSHESRLDQLSTAIRSVREASRNPFIGVMVGGPVFLGQPELVERVGADASAVDAATAVLLAQRLYDVGQIASRRRAL